MNNKYSKALIAAVVSSVFLLNGCQSSKTSNSASYKASNNAQESQASESSSFSIPYEKYTLDNGLKVILHQDKSDPIVALATIFHVGSSREEPGKTGFAHFFEHMAFNNSENVPLGANRKMIGELGGTGKLVSLPPPGGEGGSDLTTLPLVLSESFGCSLCSSSP